MSLQSCFRRSIFGRLQTEHRFVYLDCVAFFLINFHSTAARISSNYSQQVTCFHVLNIFACSTTLGLARKVPIHKILIFTSEGFPAPHPMFLLHLGLGAVTKTCFLGGSWYFSLLTVDCHACTTFLQFLSQRLWLTLGQIQRNF